MRRFWTLPLRYQLVLAILLLLVPLGLAMVWAGIIAYEERTEELAEQARIVATTTAAFVSRDLSNVDQVAQRISSDPAFVGRDTGAARDLLSRVVDSRPSLLRIVAVDATGREIARADRAPQVPDTDGWHVDIAQVHRRVIVAHQKARTNDTAHMLVAYPLATDDGPNGAIGLYLRLDVLNDAFAGVRMPPESVVTISDLSGRILARSVQPEKYVGRMLGSGRRKSVEPMSPHRGVGVDGVDRIYSEASIPAGPWIVSVGMPMSLASEQAASLWTRSFSILALGVAGWIAIALVLSTRLSRAVGHLDATAQRIATGDFSPMVHKAMVSREFAKLQTAFDWMLTRFNDTRGALDAQMAEERRIREELESLQGQVIRQERLAAVGQLVSGVAHEINNPLQAILGFSELLQMQPDVPESIKSDLRLIQKESARACGIIRNLALFARQTPGEAAPVRLSDVIASVAELRQRRLESEDIELQIDDRSGQHVMAVLTELQQVVLNFVVNAEQAIVGSGRQPGRITIRTYDRDSMVVLEVEDTGPGIPSEHEAKLFQPFFTTKPVGQGTGLGLSVSYGIIDSLHGTIGYRRVIGGSVFFFELPAAAVVDAES